MRASFSKCVVLGAAMSMLALVASTAVAGTGIGGIFNLGQSNTVNGTSGLSGSTAGPQLNVANSNTAANAQSIAGSNNSTKAATLFARNNGGGPAAAFSVLAGKAPWPLFAWGPNQRYHVENAAATTVRKRFHGIIS